jgi:hypothetical protein
MTANNTVILFDDLSIEQAVRLYDALDDLGVDYVTLVRRGEPRRFTESEIGAAPFRTAQASCVHAGLEIAYALDAANALRD